MFLNLHGEFFKNQFILKKTSRLIYHKNGTKFIKRQIKLLEKTKPFILRVAFLKSNSKTRQLWTFKN